MVRDRHDRELVHPLLVRRLADAVLLARLTNLDTKLDLHKDAGYPRFAESGFLHVETPLGWILYPQLAQVSEGASNVE